jgi:murein DD-endopeptidase MepM/ murein hydrolase activator NlpD
MNAVKLEQLLKSQQENFLPVVAFDHRKDKIVLLDFSVSNLDLTDEVLNDTKKFCDYVNGKLQRANARYGIGGYAEHRTVYSRSRIFDGNKIPGDDNQDSPEPRRFHLGTDLWGKPNSAVMAPIDAIVHSFAYNDRPGDYGATIILTHQLSGLSFHTLYGHLSLNSIKNIQEGDRVYAGDIFADFGLPLENGHWPPHLHFQVINTMESWVGDYPGVCKFSEKESYLANCPDPDLILQLNQFL